MADLKHNKQADAIGYLSRCAFYLAKNDQESAEGFLKKAVTGIKRQNLQKIAPLINHPELLADKSQHLYWAEKILDEYKRLYFLLPN